MLFITAAYNTYLYASVAHAEIINLFLLQYVQVELNPEKLLKNYNGFFLKTNNFLANQMISNDSKGINNRHA